MLKNQTHVEIKTIDDLSKLTEHQIQDLYLDSLKKANEEDSVKEKTKYLNKALDCILTMKVNKHPYSKQELKEINKAIKNYNEFDKTLNQLAINY